LAVVSRQFRASGLCPLASGDLRSLSVCLRLRASRLSPLACLRFHSAFKFPLGRRGDLTLFALGLSSVPSARRTPAPLYSGFRFQVSAFARVLRPLSTPFRQFCHRSKSRLHREDFWAIFEGPCCEIAPIVAKHSTRHFLWCSLCLHFSPVTDLLRSRSPRWVFL
jgi:hypothetical protein